MVMLNVLCWNFKRPTKLSEFVCVAIQHHQVTSKAIIIVSNVIIVIVAVVILLLLLIMIIICQYQYDTKNV